MRTSGFAALDRINDGTASLVVEHGFASEAQDLFRPLFALLHGGLRVFLAHNIPLVSDLGYADAYAAARSFCRACTGRWWRRAALLAGAASLGLLSIHIEGHLLRHYWCRRHSSDDRYNFLGRCRDGLCSAAAHAANGSANCLSRGFLRILLRLGSERLKLKISRCVSKGLVGAPGACLITCARSQSVEVREFDVLLPPALLALVPVAATLVCQLGGSTRESYLRIFSWGEKLGPRLVPFAATRALVAVASLVLVCAPAELADPGRTAVFPWGLVAESNVLAGGC